MNKLTFSLNRLYLRFKNTQNLPVMIRLFALKNEKNWKSLLLTPDRLMLVNKVYKTPEDFIEKFHEKAFLKQRLELSTLDILEIRHPEKESGTAKIFYTIKNKRTGLDLSFASSLEQQQFVDAVTKPRKMIATTAQVGVMRSIGPSLLGLGFTALFTFIVYYDAEIIESGGEVDTGGRRSLYKQLFAWLAETLGTEGTLLAGGAIGLLCVYFIYSKLKKRPVEVIYG